MILFISYALLANEIEKRSLYTDILKDYVIEGLVNYAGLKDDTRLDEYITAIALTDPSQIKDESERLAFWINAYNAYTLKIICEEYPIKSINELHSGGKIFGHIFGSTIWHKEIVTINNKKVSLNYIEHEVIRVEFDEPRIHFALVCAAIGCPPLLNEAYEGKRLNQQLENQALLFFMNLKTHSIFK